MQNISFLVDHFEFIIKSSVCRLGVLSKDINFHVMAANCYDDGDTILFIELH
jgi:hypothetical protein